MSLETAFESLVKRQATDVEIKELYRVRDALEIKSNDAVWLLLIALQYYQTLYDNVPKTIQKVTEESLKNVKVATELSLKTSQEEIKANMAEEAAKTMGEVAQSTAKKQMWYSLLGCFLVASMLLFLTAYVSFSFGKEAGATTGLLEARNEEARASWANTPQGKAAYGLFQTGSLEDLVTCSRPGWKQEKNTCFPAPTKDGKVSGWKLPEERGL